MKTDDLIVATPRGLYCAAGNFYIDPWRPVAQAMITHAHGDHLRSGSEQYYVSSMGEGVTRARLPEAARVQPLNYGDTITLGRVRVSLHPAGHILGSSQVRVEHEGEVWVVSGDYKREFDPTCAPFEVVPCSVFISEATFALPVYRWPATPSVAKEILQWWHNNRKKGVTSILFAYALGKAQRILAELAVLSEEPVLVHGAVATLVDAYRKAGISMLPTVAATVAGSVKSAGELVLAPPSAAGSPWMRRFGESRTGFCSGWMRVRGDRRRRGYDRGFVLSDHADWPGLLRTVQETGARRVLLTHGYTDAMCRYLQERGVAAVPLSTEYGAEE